MDSRDLLILGAVGFGGYLLWRHWQGQQAPQLSTNGAATSSMTASGAGASQMGQAKLSGFAAIPTLPAANAGFLGASVGASGTGGSFGDALRATATSKLLIAAAAAPQPVAPAPSVKRTTTLGTSPVFGTQPAATPGIFNFAQGLV